MDNAQLLKGILEGCVLAVIAKGETYGYEILGVLEAANFREIGEGTLYPVLARLEQNRLVQCRRAKSPLGPMRKYYSVTPRGQDVLVDFKKRYQAISDSAAAILYVSDAKETNHGV